MSPQLSLGMMAESGDGWWRRRMRPGIEPEDEEEDEEKDEEKDEDEAGDWAGEGGGGWGPGEIRIYCAVEANN